MSLSATQAASQPSQPANSRGRVIFASLIGTTIEFYDFYVYATAAVLVFPHLFFPTGDDTTALLRLLRGLRRRHGGAADRLGRLRPPR